jgi:hypothetical protein
MDAETELVVAKLRRADQLRRDTAANDAALRKALAKWHASRPGYSRRGIATEATARHTLRQAGLL